MIEKNDLFMIKRRLENNVGQKVQVKAKKGRKKSTIRNGVIESTYPSIFVVKLDQEQEAARRVSYSYTDVLTKTVELVVCSETQQMQFTS